TSSTVPLQALFLMNNAFVREQARGLARRCLAAGPALPARVALAYELAGGRLSGAVSAGIEPGRRGGRGAGVGGVDQPGPRAFWRGRVCVCGLSQGSEWPACSSPALLAGARGW